MLYFLWNHKRMLNTIDSPTWRTYFSLVPRACITVYDRLHLASRTSNCSTWLLFTPASFRNPVRRLSLTASLGIPLMGYGQSYYTLRSIFFNEVAPPVIHMHLRLFDVCGDVPIGDLSTSLSNSDVAAQDAVEVDIPAGEKEEFDIWLRDLWHEKDEAMTKYHENGTLDTVPDSPTAIDIPLKLRRKREVLDAFCFFFPAGLVYLLGRGRHWAYPCCRVAWFIWETLNRYSDTEDI